jgi:gliding motility-associated-like protein
MRLALIILIFLVAHISGIAQPPYQSNPSGWFTIDEYQGCSPLVVTITAPLCDGTKSCTIVRGNGRPNKILSTVTDTLIYFTPGSFTLGLYVVSDYSEIQVSAFQNIQPDFEIYHCSGNQVQVKVTDTNYNYQYKIDYNDGSPIIPVAAGNNTSKDNHTFASSGLKTVEVRGIIAADAADNCSPKSDTVKIRTVSLPSFSKLEVLTPSSIQLDFINQNHVLYKLEIAANNTTTFQQLQNVYNSNTTTLSSNLSPDNNNFYCFRLGRNDPCVNSTTYGVDKICSVDFDVTPGNNQNSLSWITSSLGVANYTISKNPGTAIPPRSPLLTPNYSDTDVNCELYSYQLISNYSTGMKSISLPKQGTPFSNNPVAAIANITTSLNAEGTSASLTWQPGIQPQEYFIFRNSSLLTTTTTEQFTDDSYNLDAAYCYSISYKNQCNNASPPATSCPVKLESNVLQDNITVLSWNAYTGWANGVANYKIEKYSAQGELINTFSNGTNTTYTDNTVDENNQAFYYIVKAYPNEAGVNSPATSNERVVTLNPIIIFPKAFTPDGEGPDRNDVFMPVKDQYVTEFEMEIFNRWGELVFSSHDVGDGWNGTLVGLPVPNGIYAFSVRITDQLGRKSKHNGSVLLLRTK